MKTSPPSTPDTPDDSMPKPSLRTASYRPFLLTIFIVAVVLMAVLTWPFRHALLMALILATLMHPLGKKLPRFVATRPILSATVLTLLTILFLLLPLGAVLAMLTGEAVEFSQTTVDWFKAGGINKVMAWVQGLSLPQWARNYLDPASIDIQGIESWAMSSGGELGLRFVSAGKGILGKLGNTGLQLVVTVLFLFYFLLEGSALIGILRKVSPLRRDQEDVIFSRFKSVSQSVLLGGLGTSMATGIVTGIGLWIAGINPLLWGAVAVIASLIPVVGLSMIMIPSIIYLFAIGSMKMAIFLIAYWLIVVSSVDNFVRPLFMRGKARLSVAWLFVSIIGGIVMFGFLGIIYGPLALSIALVFFEIYLEAQDEDTKEEKQCP